MPPFDAKIFHPGYLSTDITCSEKRTICETVSIQISQHFSPQMAAIVFIILHIVFATRAVLKILGYSPVLAGKYSVA